MALLLTACGTAIPKVKPYKMEIQQGNVVTSKMLLQLKPGMTKSQVRYIMGTPLIEDSFHTNRWDYFYQMRQSGKITKERRIYLTFKNSLLDKVSGDVVAQGSAAAEQGGEPANIGMRSINPVVRKQDKGFFDLFKFWGDDEEIEVPEPTKQAIDVKADALEAEKEEKGFFSRLKFWGDDDEDQPSSDQE